MAVSPVVSVLLFGIPGSGKTTIGRALQDYPLLGGSVRVVELDSFLHARLSATRKDAPSDDSAGVAPAKATDDGDRVAGEGEASSEGSSVGFTPQMWHAAFEDFVGSFAAALRDETAPDPSSCDAERSQPFSKLVVAIDNCYYASMRRRMLATVEHFNSSRREETTADDTRVRFASVHVTCSVPEALERNEARIGVHRVPDDVIRLMAERLEPGPARRQPAVSHLEVSTSAGEGMTCDSIVAKIIAHVSSASYVATPPPVEPLRETAPSALHDLDLKVRRRTGGIIKFAKESGASAATLKALAKSISAAKSHLLVQSRVALRDIDVEDAHKRELCLEALLLSADATLDQALRAAFSP